jgi:hypothetical protein
MEILFAVGNRDELRQKNGNSGQLKEIFLSLTAREKLTIFYVPHQPFITVDGFYICATLSR